MKVIYSNCLGSFVVEKGIIDSVLFESKDAVEKCIALESGNMLDEEKSLIKKYPDAVFLNMKNEKVKQIETGKINEMLSYFREKGREFFVNELKLAKRKIRESVKFDNLLINSSDCIDELNKCINLLSRRLREWFGLSCPEISKKIPDNIVFAEAVASKSRKDFLMELKISGNESMGAEIREEDLAPIRNLANEIAAMNKLKGQQEMHIESVMKGNCPNLQAVAGSNIGARLIALAGSFERLATLPASTIQILGAEKALFRHIKTGAKSPKHGIILQHQVVMNHREKGKASRQLANKISIAVKIDFFKGEFIGDKLVKQLKEKLGGKAQGGTNGS